MRFLISRSTKLFRWTVGSNEPTRRLQRSKIDKRKSRPVIAEFSLVFIFCLDILNYSKSSLTVNIFLNERVFVPNENPLRKKLNLRKREKRITEKRYKKN